MISALATLFKITASPLKKTSVDKVWAKPGQGDGIYMHDLGKDFFLHNTAVTLTLLLENLVHGHCITFTQKHSAGEVWARLVKEIDNLLQASDVEWTDSQLI